jgi:hypothetical protein
VLKLKQKSANKRPMTFIHASQLPDYSYFLYLNPNHRNQPFSAHIRSVRGEALSGASGKEYSFILCPFQDHRPAKSLHRHQSSPRLGSLPPPRQPSSVLIPVLIRSISSRMLTAFSPGTPAEERYFLMGLLKNSSQNRILYT